MDSQEDTYTALLDRAFSSVPQLSEAKSDFVVPSVDSIIQGTKTIIRNFSQIVDVARRDSTEVSKFFTKELGAPVGIERQSLVINTKVQANVLNEKVKKYFEVYVICKECHKPDTHVETIERGYEVIVCEACGAKYTLRYA